MKELQVIDTSKWQWMMVSENLIHYKKRICFGKLFDKYIFLRLESEQGFLKEKNKIIYASNIELATYAEPFIENTSLDVLWWGGVKKVFRHSDGGKIFPISAFGEISCITKKEFNELHLVNGHAEIKHEKWMTADELEII